MFNVITGPFQPTLESGLVREIRQAKAADPLASIAIVVPSEQLRLRLQWLLCAEAQCPLFDVHFLTFHQLALRLHQEQVLFQQDAEGLRLKLVHDLCFEQLLTALTLDQTSLFKDLIKSRCTTGTAKALWATIRDLKEAMVDPTIVLQGLQEGLFGEDERQKLQSLFTVYAMVEEVRRVLHIGSADDLASLMIPWVEQSNFLSRLNRVCYYGFYDLNQVQLSLFEAITEKCKVTVYFPLSNGPAFSFARRFFERYLCSGIQGNTDQENPIPVGPRSSGNEKSLQVLVMHTVGTEDETTFVCKEILKLVEEHEYHYDDVGVVVRNFEPYQASLPRIFEEHRIPFTSSATFPVIQEPLVKHLMQLSSLPLTDFYWRDVLDILTSPFYRIDRLKVKRDELRPELWQQAVRALGIHRGQEQWAHLTMLMQVAENQKRGQSHPPDEHGGARIIDREQIQILHRIVTELLADCHALPTHGTIEELTQAFWTLARKHLALPGFMDSGEEAYGEYPNQAMLAEVLQQVLAIFQEIQLVKEGATWEQWVQLFRRALLECNITSDPDPHPGVRVLDAMSARGLPFQALFLLGLNEKVFPRFIREDAFLRDRTRRVLEETFGYKIDEKLLGYEEEQLLFALLRQAAGKRLYLGYQRADEEGRPLAPSPFLTDFQSSDTGPTANPELMIPRRLSDRIRHPGFESGFLTRTELGLKLILQGYHPAEILKRAGREPQLFKNGWESLRMLERHACRLGGYDGIIHSSEKYWQEYVRHGVTPTSLEVYARCPFQFFARRVLRINSVREKMVEELPASSIGDIGHLVLQQTYRNLIEGGWPGREAPLDVWKQKVILTAEKVFAQYESGSATGYFLTWQMTKDIIIRLVSLAVEADTQIYRQRGFRPMGFEVDAEGSLGILESPFSNIKVRGRLDRVDFRNNPPGLRIVDYKFQAGSRMRSADRDLTQSGIRGLHLQPPIYVLMNSFQDQQINLELDGNGLQPEGVDFVYLAPKWESPIVRSEFEAASWKGASGRQLKSTLRKLLEGIQSGRYFIVPGEYCRHCDVSTACRRDHRPTWVRSYGASQARQLRQLRTWNLQRD